MLYKRGRVNKYNNLVLHVSCNSTTLECDITLIIYKLSHGHTKNKL